MTAEICAVDGKRPTLDGYACQACADRTDGKLGDIIELTPDARLVAAGLIRRGGGGGSNKPGSRPPLNDGATDAVDEIENMLTTLARDVAEIRGLRIAPAPRSGRTAPDPLIAAARFLSSQLEWMRHAIEGNEPYAVRAFDEIAVCAGRLRGLVNGPGEQKFLGPCGAKVTWDGEGNEVERDEACDGDVFAYAGAKDGACKACGARWSTAARQPWLDGQVREYAFSAKWIHEAHGVNVKTIRTWSARGQLKTWWRTAAGLVTPWVDIEIPAELKGEAREQREAEVKAEYKARGDRLHYVGEVLDLAAADAARRAGEQAKRARRRERAALDDDGRISA